MSYQLGWIPVVPPGCGTPLKTAPKLLPKINGTVWPGIGESAKTYEFDKTDVLEFARKQGSRRIVLEVGVVAVEFSDGWWHSDAGKDLADPVAVQPFACLDDGTRKAR